MLPAADVTAVVGSPLKLVEGKIDTSPLANGKMRSQICNYEPPGGIGSGPTTAMVTINSTDSAPAAAQWFKAQLQFTPGGKGEPLSGVGDEAVSFHASGSVYVRRKNVMANIHVGLRDLNLDKEVAMSKALAQKIAARVQ